MSAVSVSRVARIWPAAAAMAMVAALAMPAAARAGSMPSAGGKAVSARRAAAAARVIRSAANCPPLKFFGVRGSGETQQDAHGYGQTIWDVEQTVVGQLPKAAAMEVNYPAIPVVYPSLRRLPSFLHYIATAYHTSELTGIKNLTKDVTGFIKGCPNSYVVMAGYSQGAQVVGDTYLSHLTAAQQARVAGIAMLGDADFNGSSSVDIGSYDPTENGVWAYTHSKRHVHAALRSSVASYCMQGDPICNFGVGNLLACHDKPKLCPHLLYPSLDWDGHTYVVDAGDFLVDHYRDLVPSIGTKTSVLIYGDNDPPEDQSGMSNLAAVLTAAGYKVTSMPGVTSLPSDLSAYGQIWHYGAYDSPSPADQAALEAFVRGGGSVFLTGEWGGTVVNGFTDQADEDIINALVTTGTVAMPDDEDPGIGLPVNPGVIDDAAQAPNKLTTFTGSDVGGMTGVPAANVFATDADGDAAGALWDNLGPGQGRLAILMDINWAQDSYMDPATMPQVTQNLAEFLSN